MKIVILTIGTFGDVQPYVALGVGLKQAGYEVTFATHQVFSTFVDRHGLNFVPLAGDPQKWAHGTELQSLSEAGGDFRAWMRRLRYLAKPLMADILNSCWQAGQGADAIIYSPLAWAGYSMAEKLNVPSFIACLQPMTATGCFPAVWSPQQPRLGRNYNRLTHLFVEQAYWYFNRSYINHWRSEFLGLAPLPVSGPYSQARWKKQPYLYGYSSSIIPRPDDWPDRAQVTGYWFLPQDEQWQPDGKLADFIAAGSPPVYIGFGSMPDARPEQLDSMVMEALRMSGQRAVVQGQWSRCGENTPSGNIFRTGWVPHAWLFPRMAAIVHHGGASTVANALRAGVPSIVVPFSWDQPFWGERISELGLGSRPVPRKKLTAAALSRAIRSCLDTPVIRHKASATGKVVLGEAGVFKAVKIIERYLK